MRRSFGSSVQSGGIGASRQRSAPLSKVSQPRRYSSVRPMVFAGMVSQTIHRVPASSSNSLSAMRKDDCTGQTTVVDGLGTPTTAARPWLSRLGPGAARVLAPLERRSRSRGRRVVAGRRGRASGPRTGRRACRIARNVAGDAFRRPRQRAAARARWLGRDGRSRTASTSPSGGGASSGWRPRSPSRTRAVLPMAGPPAGVREGCSCEDQAGRPFGGSRWFGP